MSDNHAPPDEARLLSDLHAAALRPGSTVNADGSFELGFGTMILLGGLIPVLAAYSPKSQWTSCISLLGLLCMAFAPFAVPKLIKRLITWPRTGYVANANEVKFSQLVLLMVFGGALGTAAGLGFVIVHEVCSGKADLHSFKPLLRIGLALTAAAMALYLGRRLTRRPCVPPGASVNAEMAAALNQTPVGKTALRAATRTVRRTFLGVAVLLAILVLGLLWIATVLTRGSQLDWPKFGAIAILLVSNAGLYLMCNGVGFKQHPWKWLMAAALLIGPVAAAVVPLFPEVQKMENVMTLLLPPGMLMTLGLIWIASGSLTLGSFIRHNPLPSIETE